MKCYASDYCQKDKSSCSDVCGGYRVLRALYNLSRIPERYRYTIALKPENGEDLEAFTTLDNYKNDVLSMVDEGRGLYIWGKSTGNGKTSWACKIMSYFFRKIAFNTGLENEGLYIFLPTFLEDLRDNYDNKDPEFDEILRMIKTCRLLIIDDIGAERVTDWVRELLRWRKHRSLVICTVSLWLIWIFQRLETLHLLESVRVSHRSQLFNKYYQ